MSVKVIGSHLCPDTLYALNKLSENHVEMDFVNMSSSMPDLKEYLALRDSNPLYKDVKENGGLGIPCFILEDGSVTLDLDEVLKQL